MAVLKMFLVIEGIVCIAHFGVSIIIATLGAIIATFDAADVLHSAPFFAVFPVYLFVALGIGGIPALTIGAPIYFLLSYNKYNNYLTTLAAGLLSGLIFGLIFELYSFLVIVFSTVVALVAHCLFKLWSRRIIQKIS